ncbi:MAG: type IV conjugative transfer system protein TraE [Waddliaceae bacterium]|nr:type IV conjugative transfer system protein TraE [Waddliaceae bacterium]|tara:strand:- start:39 stop:593 length:555 start_codon:yes stop_codon:yes gene_type:complete
MNELMMERDLNNLRKQRNALTAICTVLSLSVILQGVFLFKKQDRVVIVPPVVNQSFWVDNQHISVSYLEQMGVFLGELLLSKSYHSSLKQREILLKHASPGFATSFRKKLLEEEAKLKNQNSSYVFHPESVRVNQNKRLVLLEGNREVYVNGKRISTQKETYVLHFSYLGGRLLLDGVSQGENK